LAATAVATTAIAARGEKGEQHGRDGPVQRSLQARAVAIPARSRARGAIIPTLLHAVSSLIFLIR
jgi:hypothetical protein